MAKRKKKTRPIDDWSILRKTPDPEVVEQFNDFWAQLVCEENGRLNRNAVMRELFDFATLMDAASKVYCHVSGGMISKHNTLPEVVIAVATDKDNEALEEILADEKNVWRNEYEAEPRPGALVVNILKRHQFFDGWHASVTVPEGSFRVIWCTATEQFFVDDGNPLPHVWRDPARDIIKALTEERT